MSTKNVEYDFEDIRPFHDHEVRAALDRLIDDDEFISAIIDLRRKKRSRLLKALAYPFVRQKLRRKLKKVENIHDIQIMVKDFIDRMLSETSTSLTITGLDRLSPQKSYLFVGNHRDIVLDPALINYSLFKNGHDTVRIAIGDNLQSKEFISDLMRLNKSFIVRRSVKKPRERLAVFAQLSAYIFHSVVHDNSSVWIAQSEGRAKDGRDITQQAIIKMIGIVKHKKESWSDYVKKLNIVPVSISYELDPCDHLKARELYIRKNEGSYTKAPHEDYQSIARGVRGDKGRIHISFGEPLNDDYQNPEDIARAIDYQIITNYQVWENNQIAYHLLNDLNMEHIDSHMISLFKRRLSTVALQYREQYLKMYAAIIELKKECQSWM